MEGKLHIKAIAGHNVKIDAMWYHYGDSIDCYLTPKQFKDYCRGFIDFDILLDDCPPAKSEIIEQGVSQDEQIRNTQKSKSKNTRENSKKTTV